MMFTTSIQSAGGALSVMLLMDYVEANHLEAGMPLQLEIVGAELRVAPITRKRQRFSDLLAATPQGLHRVEGRVGEYW